MPLFRHQPGHTLKLLTLLIAAVTVLAGAWFAWSKADLGGALPSLSSLASADPAAPTTQSVRKCIQDGRAVYTDGDCPAGSRPQTIQTDRVTVLPAAPQPAAAAASAVGKRLPNVRDLLGTPADGSLKDKQMDRVIGE